MKYLNPILASACAFLVSTSAQADELRGKVSSVIDGDTIKVIVDQNEITVRLDGVDAPEKNQPNGVVAQFRLKRMIGEQQIVIQMKGIDVQGQTLGVVMTGSENVNRRMIADGWAWHSNENSDTELADLETAARTAKIGIWASKQAPEAPWDYRHKKLMESEAAASQEQTKPALASEANSSESSGASKPAVASKTDKQTPAAPASAPTVSTSTASASTSKLPSVQMPVASTTTVSTPAGPTATVVPARQPPTPAAVNTAAQKTAPVAGRTVQNGPQPVQQAPQQVVTQRVVYQPAQMPMQMQMQMQPPPMQRYDDSFNDGDRIRDRRANRRDPAAERADRTADRADRPRGFFERRAAMRSRR